MRAAVFYAPRNLKIETEPDPTPRDNEIVIRPMIVGICPTDVKVYFEGSNNVKPPIILGHEVAGVVVDKGKDVTHVDIGDRVNIAADAPCMRCKYCSRGFHNLCEDMISLGFNINGAYATLMKVHYRFVENNLIYKVPEDVSFEEAALIEPVAVSLNALQLVVPTPTDKVAIIGDGPNALIHLMLLKNVFGVKFVVVVGMLEHRLKAALDLGADRIVNVAEVKLADLPRAVGEVDIVDLTVSNKESIEEAIMLAKKATRITIFGGSRPDVPLQITVNKIHYDQLLITGSSGTTIENYNKAYRIVVNKKIDLKKIVTNYYNLEELPYAFEQHRKGIGLKSVVKI